MNPTRRRRAPVDQLIAEGRLENVPPDMALAHRLLRTATRNLDAVPTIEASATELAYTGSYDAARLAITAHMAAAGLRVTNRPGAHMAVMQYGEAELAGLVEADLLDGLDGMRRLRNDTEYGARAVSAAEVQEAHETAKAITAAVLRTLLTDD